MKLFKYLLSMLLIGGTMFFYSCKEDTCEDDPALCTCEESPENCTDNLAAVMAGNTNLTQLAPFIEGNAELAAIINGTGNFTFFAPSNEAFDVLKETLGVSDLTQVRTDVIAEVLAFHFASGFHTMEELTTAGSITSSQGEDIVFNEDGTILTGGSNTAVEVTSSTNANNGIVHVVNRVLIPPSVFQLIGLNLGKLSQPILLLEMFRSVDEARIKSDVFATENSLPTITSMIIDASASFTMFLPTNATFIVGQITAETFTGQQWYGILSNHMVPGVVEQSDLTHGATFTTLFTADGVNFGQLGIFNNTGIVPAANGIGIFFDSNGDVDLTLSDGGASLTNLDAEYVQSLLPEGVTFVNGVIHVIAGVLAPPAE